MGRKTRGKASETIEDRAERVLIVGVQLDGQTAEDSERSLDELAELVDSAGGEVVGRLVQRRSVPDPAYFVGKGKATEISETITALGADTTIFDDELSPAQLRNVEELVNGKVIDRTILILDIFAQRAHSREGKAQVELAQLNYGLPRLRGWGIALSRIGATGGGRGPIGTRGPGETQLEVDRRRIERRLVTLRKELQTLQRQRRTSRARRDVNIDTISLVGYTNAGKSTLLNLLTDAGVEAENRLFSTLDPTARHLELPSGAELVLSDTVGFIRKLPHGLVEAFKSTLEDVAGADLLIHVVDSSVPDPVGDVVAVETVLEEIAAAEVPRILALNKCDIAPEAAEQLQRRWPEAVKISAATGDGVSELLAAAERLISESEDVVDYRIPHAESGELGRLYDESVVIETEHTPEEVLVTARVKPPTRGRYRRFEVSGDAPAPR